jgi:molybdopterin-guanine dinucleotide biosynthesis protein A
MIFSDILGVVLAGGASRRMGHDKALLPWTGTTLAHRAAEVLSEVCGDVVIAGPDELALADVETVADLFPGLGPLAGLHAGLERAAGKAIFALACDMPFVGVDLVRHLATLADTGVEDATAEGAWVAAGDSGTQPLCGVYAPHGRPVAEDRLRAGELSVLGFLEAIRGVAVPVSAELDFYRPELLLNLNRPDELREARRLQTAGAAGAPR